MINAAGPAAPNKLGAQTGGYPQGPNSEFQHGAATQAQEPTVQPRSYNMQAGSILGEHGPSMVGRGNQPADRQEALYGKQGESVEQFEQTDYPAMMKRLSGNTGIASSGVIPGAPQPQDRISNFMSQQAVKPTH